MRRALSRRTIFLAATAALLTLAWVAAPAYALQLSPAEPHSPNAEAIHSTYWVMFVLALILIIAINAALIVAVMRFRERRGREPAQVHAGRGALRPALGVLAVVAIAVFVYGVIRTDDVRTVEASGPDGLGTPATTQVGIRGLAAVGTSESASGGPTATGSGDSCDTSAAQTSPLVINAIAQQWVWRFEYPGSHSPATTFAYQELVVPVDTTVILNVRSTDVLHSWFVPSLGGQIQATPGDQGQTWFKADEEGLYSGSSTVFSGTSYPAMRSWVRVVSVPEYQDYVQTLCEDIQEAQSYVEENEPPASSGETSSDQSSSGGE
jgi:cytochrome c oxidase subunit 2